MSKDAPGERGVEIDARNRPDREEASCYIVRREGNGVPRRRHLGFTILGFNHLTLVVIDTEATEPGYMDGLVGFQGVTNHGSKRVNDVFSRCTRHG